MFCFYKKYVKLKGERDMRKIERIPYRGKELLPAKRDIVFKALMTADGDLELLASLLSSILEIDIRADGITVTNTELSPTYEEGKLSRIDVRIKLADGKHIQVEIQLRDLHNMANRSIFYLSRIYTEQMKTKIGFRDICPTIAINILDFNYLPFSEYHNKYRLKNVRNNHELTDVFEINFIELKKVLKENRSGLKDVWMLFLAADSEEVLDMLSNEDPIMVKALSKLQYVSADEKVRQEFLAREEAEIEYYAGMTSSFREGEEAEREKWQGIVAEKETLLAEKDMALAEKDATLAEKDATLAEKDSTIVDLLVRLGEYK
jgi:predicted transposase/invertase (TIGR01784 family)